MTDDIISILENDYGTSPENADIRMLYNAVSKAAMKSVRKKIKSAENAGSKRACYLSAEFLTGRMIYNNLLNLGLLEECESFLNSHGISASVFEEIEDNALGNGGLGRLAACFLDSAATHDIPLDGYGIRYRYGIFRQHFENGFQCETEDDWTRFGDPWSIRREELTETVCFGNQTVLAVPYDMPVIGYGGKTINTLRLWQAEPLRKFNFEAFNAQDYSRAFEERNKAEEITAVLYPNDNGYEGKKLRLRQQYFFASASMQSIIRSFVAKNGTDFRRFHEFFAVQLNDTHPVVAIPEFLRILTAVYHIPVAEALDLTADIFAYTNHTVMAEAMEKWDISLFRSVLPELYPYIIIINNRLAEVLSKRGISKEKYEIISGGCIHMARLAVFASGSVNGVAEIHTEILKNRVLKEWYELFPERFNNKTNGITQRRFLLLCNRELACFITEKISDAWICDADELKKLLPYTQDKESLDRFFMIKKAKKEELCRYIEKHENITLSPDFIFDIQIKRLHEYKRQLLNILTILHIYHMLKEKSIDDFNPTAFIFGAKAAPGYGRAKAVIKLINEAAKLINNDPDVNDRLRVVFISNYNVSYAEKLVPAADISEQISTAGTEASGTGNMKFMLNGAVTLGTLDGANIEIVNEAGKENNYIFGADVEKISSVSQSYDPKKIYDENPGIKKTLDMLIDGTLSDDGTGIFRELYDSLLKGASWHKADHYYLLLDWDDYIKTCLRANKDYSDKYLFTKKCFVNTANAGKFSADRTVKEYAKEIWKL